MIEEFRSESSPQPVRWTEPGDARGEYYESEIDLAHYWSLIVKGRAIIIGCVLLGLFGAIVMSLLSKPVYRARTTLVVEREKNNPFNIAEQSKLYSSNDPEFLPTQTKLLTSREIAARVVQRLHLDQRPEVAQQKPSLMQSLKFWDKPQSVADENRTEWLAESLAAGVQTNVVKGTNLIEVYYTAGSPKMAANVANAVAAAYIDWSMEAKFEVLTKASQFITTQVEQLKADIESKERQLQAYGDQKDIISMDPQANVTYQNLESLNRDYAEAVADRVAKEARYREVQNTRADALAEATGAESIAATRADVAKLEREYAEKLGIYKPDWPAMQQLRSQLEKTRQQLNREIGATVAKVRELARADYLTALRREESLKAVLQTQKTEVRTLNRNAVEYNNLQVEVQTKRALLDTLLKRQAETQVSSRLEGEKVSNVRVVDHALPPRVRFKPSYKQNGIMGLLLGLVGGLGIVLLQEYLDRSLRSPEQVTQYLRVPTLGVIPAAGESSRSYGYYGYFKKVKPVAGEKPMIELLPHRNRRSTIAEAYRAFRTALLLSQAGGIRSVVITSTMPSEGKTSTALNLAVVLGQLGKRVLIVDADLHKPRLHEILRISNRVGLVSVLAENAAPNSAIVETPVPGVFALPGGPTTPNPSGLLSSKAMKRFLETAYERFDYVVIDSPPVSPIADAIILGHLADGVVLCVQGNRTPRDAVARVRDELLRANVRILGVLLNNVIEDPTGYGKYGYYDKGYYGAAEQPAPARATGTTDVPFIEE